MLHKYLQQNHPQNSCEKTKEFKNERKTKWAKKKVRVKNKRQRCKSEHFGMSLSEAQVCFLIRIFFALIKILLISFISTLLRWQIQLGIFPWTSPNYPMTNQISPKYLWTNQTSLSYLWTNQMPVFWIFLQLLWQLLRSLVALLISWSWLFLPSLLFE